jgi:hypothetical protein
MNKYVCIVQKDQFADQNRQALAEGLKKIGSECLGDDAEETEIDWVVARKGFSFKADGLSTSSIVERSVPAGLPQDQREIFLKKVCEFWQKGTGCSVNEIKVLAWDGPLPTQL